MIRKLLPLALVALIAASCASPSSSKSSPTPAASKRPSSTATLAIVSPRNGETVRGPKVHVAVTLTGATIVPFTTTTLTAGEGHLHVKLDGQVKSMAAGTSLDLTDVAAGSHVVIVEFVAADHAPFDPRVFVAVTFTVA